MNRNKNSSELAKVLLVTLNGCDKCKKLKASLAIENISVHNMDCDDNPNFCDELENQTNTSNYPMALTEHGSLEMIHYVAESYKDLKYTNVIKNNYILQPYLSLELMIEALKQNK
jgi:glutaredoxin